ncbi:hypothetical protein EDD85DRAFT_1028585, partial [Armillaria nabsnona]
MSLTPLSIRQQAAHISRAHLSKSVAIVHCCRIIIGEKNLATSSDAKRALELALKALKVASDKHAKEQDIVLVYGEAVTAIMSVKGLHPDRLRNIRERTESAKSKDTDVQATRSSILKRLKESVAPNKPNFEVDVRVREDIKEESGQNASVVLCRETDTLDIVLLTMVVRKRNRLLLPDNPHFYEKSFEDIANVSTVHKSALPFDSVLRDISLARDSKMIYCLLDHKSGNFVLLRSVEIQRFSNIWRIDVSGKYILKETIGDLRSADWIISQARGLNADRVKIVKRSIHTNSEESTEVRKDRWSVAFKEVCDDFKKEEDITWTIEVNSAQHVPLMESSPQGRIYQVLPASIPSSLVSKTPTAFSSVQTR